MKKFIRIHQKSWPNPYSVYEVEITRYGPKRTTKEREVSEERTRRIISIVGLENFGAELEGGIISLYGSYP